MRISLHVDVSMMMTMITDIVFPSFDNKQRQQQKSFPIDILNKQIFIKIFHFFIFLVCIIFKLFFFSGLFWFPFIFSNEKKIISVSDYVLMFVCLFGLPLSVFLFLFLCGFWKNILLAFIKIQVFFPSFFLLCFFQIKS